MSLFFFECLPTEQHCSMIQYSTVVYLCTVFSYILALRLASVVLVVYCRYSSVKFKHYSISKMGCGKAEQKRYL